MPQSSGRGVSNSQGIADCYIPSSCGRTSGEYDQELSVAAANPSSSYHYQPGRPQCGQGLRTTRRQATPPWAVILSLQCRQRPA